MKQYTLAKRKCNEDSTGRHFHIIPGRTRCKKLPLVALNATQEIKEGHAVERIIKSDLQTGHSSPVVE